MDTWGLRAGIALLGLTLSAVAAEPLAVTGQVLYGAAEGAKTGATTDIVAVYGSNPVYMHMKKKGLSETDASGAEYFGKAQKTTNTALATVAKGQGVDVVTVPGGVTGGEIPITDLTAAVVEKLPRYYVEPDEVLFGNERDARSIAQVDAQTVLEAIPAWKEAQKLDPSDARYHLLRNRYTQEFNRVVKEAAQAGGYDLVSDRGAVTLRVGTAHDITSTAVSLIQQ